MSRKILKMTLFNVEEEVDLSKLITNPVAIDERTREFTEDGMFSPKIFSASDPSSPPSCDCGEVAGSFRVGEICSSCGYPVKTAGNVYDDVGWIDLGTYIINPWFWNHIKTVVGDDLDKIVADPKFNIDGLQLVNEQNPLYNTGIRNLIENLNPILKMYSTTKVHKKIVEFMESHWDLIFQRYVPVYSTLLRPGVLMQGSVFKFAKENRHFNQLVSLSHSIKQHGLTSIAENAILVGMQTVLCDLMKDVIKRFPTKFGFMRAHLLGCRVNFTCSCVIVPSRENVPWQRMMRHIELPYVAAVELYKFEIINLLSKTGFSYSDAMEMIEDSKIVFNKFIYDTLMEVGRMTGGFRMLLNRPPTLNLGSILLVEPKIIKTNDLTIGLQSGVFPIMAADSDGDVVRTVSLKTTTMRNQFMAYYPERLMISLNDGLFNSDFLPDKDYALGISTLT